MADQPPTPAAAAFPGILPDNPIDIFDVVAKLGEGSYGSVFKVRLPGDLLGACAPNAAGPAIKR